MRKEEGDKSSEAKEGVTGKGNDEWWIMDFDRKLALEENRDTLDGGEKLLN